MIRNGSGDADQIKQKEKCINFESCMLLLFSKTIIRFFLIFSRYSNQILALQWPFLKAQSPKNFPRTSISPPLFYLSSMSLNQIYLPLSSSKSIMAILFLPFKCKFLKNQCNLGVIFSFIENHLINFAYSSAKIIANSIHEYMARRLNLCQRLRQVQAIIFHLQKYSCFFQYVIIRMPISKFLGFEHRGECTGLRKVYIFPHQMHLINSQLIQIYDKPENVQSHRPRSPAYARPEFESRQGTRRSRLQQEDRSHGL